MAFKDFKDMDTTVRPAISGISGTVAAPTSKSSVQRAIACATLARGVSALEGVNTLCQDSLSALGVAASLGAQARRSSHGIAVRGSELFHTKSVKRPLKASALTLDCGESGLCIRMFSPIAASLGVPVVLNGHGTLSRRPMDTVTEPLTAMGAACSSAGGHVPLRVQGPLRGGERSIDLHGSSQLLTGLLMALPLIEEDTVLAPVGLASRGYLDLTIDTCAAFGVRIFRNSDFSEIRIPGRQEYSACSFSVEGDWSGTAFLICAAAIAGARGGLRIAGLRPDSAQPDRAVLEVASAAGARVAFEGSILLVEPGSLRPFEFDATGCPDLFPPLVALAAACPGTSRITGTERLHGKESDRAASLTECFSRFGIAIEHRDNSLYISGGTPKGCEVDAYGDHRIAMAAGITALRAEDPIVIQGAECVAKSWPEFFEVLDSIRTSDI